MVDACPIHGDMPTDGCGWCRRTGGCRVTALITDHVFRGFTVKVRPSAVGLCAYMNCRKPRDEHARAFRPRTRGAAR